MHGVKAHFHFDPRASRVLVNRIQIQQVLINSMRNAVEAMAASERCDLEVKTSLLDDATIEISVADRHKKPRAAEAHAPGVVYQAAPGNGGRDEGHLFEPLHDAAS